jgi:uncharacterized membrane protein YhaH (DUF805 family)
MNFKWMRCKVEGRINRARCWEAALQGAISFLIFTLIFGAGLKLVQVVYLAVFKNPLPFDASIGYILLFYAGLNMDALEAVTIKRLHDRNKSGWWIVPFFIAPLLLHGLSDRLDNPTFGFVVNALAFGLGLWCFIELLCLRGTSGPNRFGSDPLAPRKTRSNWVPRSEIEPMPHSVGPPPAWLVRRDPE